MNLVELLERHAEVRGDQVAIADGEHEVTFSQLRDRVRAMAEHLSRRGLGPGSRGLLFVPMSVDLYVSLLGLLHLGAVAVFVDPGMGRRQIETALRLAEPDAFIAVPRAHLLRVVSPRIRQVPLKITAGGHRLTRRLAGEATDRPPHPVAPEAPALLTFTSGTTGQPKGTMRSHGFLLAQHHALTEVLGLTPRDVDMPALPIFLLNTLASGATAVIPPIGKRVADVDGARLCALMIERGVTTSGGSPALYQALAAHCRAQGVTLPAVRALFLGGAPVPPGLLGQLQPILPNGDTWVVYGSTEAEPISHVAGSRVLAETAADTARGAGLCVGIPVESVRVRLVDDEILVAGPHVNTSYFNDEAAVKRFKVPDADGTIWHRTGDAARFDDQGRLWLLGRTEHVVEREGRRIYPFAVELAARERPGVRQAALLELNDKVTLVVEGEGPGLDGLIDLDPGIDEVRRMKRIPTDPRHNAKIDYATLRHKLGAT